MKSLLSSLLLFLSLNTFGQNSYYTITEINPAQRWLRSNAAIAADASTRLLIYQYAGANINSIGAVSNLNGTGHYDLNKVIRTGGDTIFLALPVTHSYRLNKTQLVTFQSQENIELSGMQNVSQPFNGSTGGITFLAADGRITLNAGASLNVTGAGFRGAAGTQSASECNRVTQASGNVYALNDWRGSPRGGGVTDLPTGQESGRAPAANGGGGGNDHNAGGGGGANASNGGIGARNIVMGLFNNACRGNYPGIGGNALESRDDQIYFGGGGGAGHANNTTQANGGNGGGIIILWAQTIEFGNNTALRANGNNGNNVNGDGGGGGGAGGSILLLADTLRGNPEILLEGGKGGDVTNQSTRCFGPGGGGSGGRLLTAALHQNEYQPSVSLREGGNGLRLRSDECGPNDEPAGDGEPGLSKNILLPVPFGGLAQSADTLCGGNQLTITDASAGAQNVTWQIVPASNAISTTNIGTSLRINLANTASGTFQVVQTLIGANGVAYPGDTATFTVIPSANVTSAIVRFDQEIVNVSLTGASNYTSILYDFGDGTVLDTSATSLQHIYTSSGDYVVTVTLLNDQCGDRVVINQRTNVGEFASAEISLKNIDGCAPLIFDIADISTGSYTDRVWNFPGGSPSSANDVRVRVTYDAPGNYTASLTLIGAVGDDTVRTLPITVFPQPVADFSFTVDTASAAFTNLSTEVTDHFWDFGDDSLSMAADPTHTYLTTGTYEVVYIAQNGPCRDTLRQTVVIDVLSDVADLNTIGVQLFPNPTSGLLRLTGPARIAGAFDLSGRMLRVPFTAQSIDLSSQPAGTYIVRVEAGGKTFSKLVIVR